MPEYSRLYIYFTGNINKKYRRIKSINLYNEGSNNEYIKIVAYSTSIFGSTYTYNISNIEEFYSHLSHYTFKVYEQEYLRTNRIYN